MLLETYDTRYELAPKGTNSAGEEEFVFSKCTSVLFCKQYRSVGVPLPESHKVVLQDNVVWEEIQWGVHDVYIRGDKYSMVRMQFLSLEPSES